MLIFKIILKISVCLLCLLGAMVLALNVYMNFFSDKCLTYDGLPFTSPDGKFNAYGTFISCEGQSNEMKIWLKEINGDKPPTLVFDSIYTTSIKMDLKWESYNELKILYPKGVNPMTKFGMKNGIRLYYESF